MSFNRLHDDICTSQRQVTQSASILGYILNPMRFEHKHKCRHDLGIVGGTAVSHVQGNLVDLESELRGQTRLASMCATKQHLPAHARPSGATEIKNDKTPPISTKLEHLPRCQMISYKAVPLPPPMQVHRCNPRSGQ